MTKNVYWILKLDIAEGKSDELQPIAEKLCEFVRAEPGSLAYEWSMSADGKQVHILERWADSAAALAHAQNIGPQLGELSAITTPVSGQCYGAVSDELRTTLSGWPFQFNTTFAGFS